MIGDLDGEYKHDSRRNLLEWNLPVIDANNKTGSLEFSVAGQSSDFFPIGVTFVSKRNYCDIQVGVGSDPLEPLRHAHQRGRPLLDSPGGVRIKVISVRFFVSSYFNVFICIQTFILEPPPKMSVTSKRIADFGACRA